MAQGKALSYYGFLVWTRVTFCISVHNCKYFLRMTLALFNCLSSILVCIRYLGICFALDTLESLTLLCMWVKALYSTAMLFIE